VQVKLQRDNRDQPIDLEVIVDEDGRSDLQAAQTVSIRPTAIPMLLDNIACNLVYRPGRLTVMHLSGSRDLSRVKAEGSCWIRNDGSWDGTLTWLPGTRLIIDQNLISNLPEKLGQPLTSLDFHGPVNVMGWTHFVDDRVTQHPYANAWDLRLDIEDGRLGQGQIVSGIRGAVLLEGETRSDGPVVVGNFDLDSLALRGIPVIGLRGGFALQNGQSFFGREASVVTLDRKQPMNVVDSELKFGNSSPMSLVSFPKDLSNVLQLATPNSPTNASLDNQPTLGEFSISQKSDITARIAGGRLSLHGTGQVATGRTNLRISMEELSLKESLQELGQPNLTTTGKVNAQLQLSGSLANVNTISGVGAVQLREAQLYELPSLARLLRLLSVRPQDDSAFESADIEFRIDGDRIPLERLSLDGDIISLRGSGWTNLRREIHLDLYTYIGQKSRLATMFAPVLSHNDASLLYVEVDGTLDKFAIQKKLPMLESTLEQVFPEKAQIPASQRKNSRISPSGP
jgi:AsmA-like C-terminal region